MCEKALHRGGFDQKLQHDFAAVRDRAKSVVDNVEKQRAQERKLSRQAELEEAIASRNLSRLRSAIQAASVVGLISGPVVEAAQQCVCLLLMDSVRDAEASKDIQRLQDALEEAQRGGLAEELLKPSWSMLQTWRDEQVWRLARPIAADGLEPIGRVLGIAGCCKTAQIGVAGYKAQHSCVEVSN